jgi:hypothetical protein
MVRRDESDRVQSVCVRAVNKHTARAKSALGGALIKQAPVAGKSHSAVSGPLSPKCCTAGSKTAGVRKRGSMAFYYRLSEAGGAKSYFAPRESE